MPSMVSSGNAMPQSTKMASSPHSYMVMFLPISLSPPIKEMRTGTLFFLLRDLGAEVLVSRDAALFLGEVAAGAALFAEGFLPPDLEVLLDFVAL